MCTTGRTCPDSWLDGTQGRRLPSIFSTQPHRNSLGSKRRAKYQKPNRDAHSSQQLEFIPSQQTPSSPSDKKKTREAKKRGEDRDHVVAAAAGSEAFFFGVALLA